MRRHILLTLFTAAVLCVHAADRAREVQFQKALDLMQTKGDLAGAIKLLEEVGKSPDRNLVARSLLHLGECRLKLGQQEASKPFERVVREFSDQRDVAAEARARLASFRPKPALQSGIADRKLLTVPDGGWIEGKISPDGRYVPYVNYKDGGNLYLHDLASGTDRQLTNTGTDGRPRAPGVEYQCGHEHAFSRDGKQLAYTWHRGGTHYELRVVNLQGSGIPAFRKLLAHEDVEWLMPHDWSPDGKWIAVQMQRKDKIAQIGLVGAEDGSLRVLKSVDWRGPNTVAFSPDGRYLAYDLAAGETTSQRDIYVLAVDGSREVPAEVHPGDDTLLGWTPDGSRLLFASDRSGGTDLWARQFSEGKPQGRPELLKRDIGRFQVMGVTSSGSLHYVISSNSKPSDVMTAEFDFGKGDYASPPVQAVGTYNGTNRAPDWSRDGKYLAWISFRKSHITLHFVIGFRSLEDSQVRELLLPPSFYVFSSNTLSWSHDGKSFVISGQDKGRDGIFRVDRESGHTSLLVDVQRPLFAIESPDGSNLYYSAGLNSGEFALVKRVLASAEETVLLKGKYHPFVSLSVDGRYLAVQEAPRPRTPAQAVLLVPTDGGAPRELSRVNAPDGTAFLAWTPDRKSVLIAKFTPAGNTERWRIPLDGGVPKQLDAKTELPGGFKLHPDGRHLAFQVPVPSKPPEVWVLENFLPSPAANR